MSDAIRLPEIVIEAPPSDAAIQNISYLRSKRLSRHWQFQRAARPYSTAYIRRGHKGSHIWALQSALNDLRRSQPWRTWPWLKIDGHFGAYTEAAVQACQDAMNRKNRRFADHQGRLAQHLAKKSDSPHGRAVYLKAYYEARHKLKIDGIVGWRTLSQLDMHIEIYELHGFSL